MRLSEVEMKSVRLKRVYDQVEFIYVRAQHNFIQFYFDFILPSSWVQVDFIHILRILSKYGGIPIQRRIVLVASSMGGVRLGQVGECLPLRSS